MSRLLREVTSRADAVVAVHASATAAAQQRAEACEEAMRAAQEALAREVLGMTVGVEGKRRSQGRTRCRMAEGRRARASHLRITVCAGFGGSHFPDYLTAGIIEMAFYADGAVLVVERLG